MNRPERLALVDHADPVASVVTLRIPTKSATDSDVISATCSD